MTASSKLLTLFSSFLPLDGLIYAALAALLIIQIGMVLRLRSLSKHRLWTRLGLNVLLWSVLLLFAIQPQWTFSGNTSRVLLISENTPAAAIQKAKDSLKITESFLMNDFNRHVAEDPDFVGKLGSVFVLGQAVSPWTLGQLSQKEIHWLPLFQSDELQDIHWKAILRKGEFQEVTGQLELTEPKVIKINYGDQVLDSVLLPKGLQTFRLRFPAFAIGRTETTLKSGDDLLQKVVFYSRKPQSSSVCFVLESPDFESKTLAEWLGKSGNRVMMLTNVAKNSQSKVLINQSGKQKTETPDIVITDPMNASHPLVKKAVAEGKSVLFFNLTNPEQELKTVNAALGTQWRVKKISNEQSIAAGNGVTALPYQLEENKNQQKVADYPAAVQKTGGRVGVSLLNETFSLKLSGDSLMYGKIWSGIMQQLNPPFEGNIQADAPIWKDTRTDFVLNKFMSPPGDLSVANDTTSVQFSALNTLTSGADYIFRKSGWQPFMDSLEVYVEDRESTVSKARRIEETLRAYHPVEKRNAASTAQSLTARLPAWAWLVLFLLCFTALWIEPKLKF